MARIHLSDSAAGADDLARAAFDTYAPEIGAAALAFSKAAYQHNLLSLREMEGARFRTAQINGCVACQAFRGGRDLGGLLERSGGDPGASALTRGDPPSDEYYAAIPDYATSPLFSDRERLAIELAERMGERPHSMEGDEAFWSSLHAAFSDKEIVDLTLTIASWMALGRTVHTLELDGVCSIATIQRSTASA